MKQALIITLLTLFSLPSFGQKVWFSDNTNEWWGRGSSGTDMGVPYLYHYKNTRDTFLNGRRYTIHPPGLHDAYIRDDTSLGKVFVIYPKHDTDTSEQLLYDYTLQVGDTFYSALNKHYVTDVDSTVINTVWHKTWYLKAVPNHVGSHYAIDYIVIEGIGSLKDPLNPLFPMMFEGTSNLICFSTNGVIPLVSPIVEYFDNASSCHAKTTIIDNAGLNFRVVPNPISNSSHVIFSKIIYSGTLTVINDVGLILSTTPFYNKDSISVGDKVIQPGLYCYKIMDNSSGELHVGKFVVE